MTRTSNIRAAHRPLARLAAALTVAASLAALAACSSGHPDPAGTALPSSSIGVCTPKWTARCTAPSPTPTPKALLTAAQAQAVLANYVKINNAANAVAVTNPAKARALNAQIENNPLRSQSLAQFTKLKIATANDRAEYAKPFYYTNTRFYIPTTTSGQAPFFFAISHNKKDPVLLVFVQGTDKVWKNSAAVWLDGPAPSIALDAQGNATAVAPDASGLALRPSLLSAAVNDNYVSGGKTDGAALAATKDAKAQRAAKKNWDKSLRPLALADATAANDPYQMVWALKTTAGGALAVSSRAFDQHDFAITPDAEINIPAHNDARAWVGSHTPSLTMNYTCLDAAAIPKAGKASQIGEDCEMEHATG